MPALLSHALVGLVLGWGPVSTDAYAPTPVVPAAAKQEIAVVPTVRVEIKLPRAMLKSKYQRLDWDQPGAVELTRGDVTHHVDVTVKKRDGNGKKLTLTLSYEQDGEPVIAPFTFDTRAKKREIFSTDGGIALAVTVRPKQVTVESEDHSRDEEDQIEGHESDDPLDGLLDPIN